MKIIRSVLLGFVIVFSAGLQTEAAPDTAKKVEQMKQTALELLNQGKFNKAIPLLKEILALNPSDKTAARYLLIARQQIVEPFCKQAADAYFENNYPKAIEHWENILRVNPDDRRVIGLIESAKNLIQDNTIESLYALVDKFLRDGKYKPAVNELEKILVINPEERRAQDLLRSTVRAINDIEIKGHYEKADAYMKQKRYDLAIDAWKEVLKVDPEQDAASRLIASTIRTTFLGSTYNTAEKLYAQGDYTSSLEQYNRILLDNPTDQYVKNIINRLKNILKIAPKLEQHGNVWDMLRKSLINYISMDGSQRVALAAAWYAVQLDPDNNTAAAARDFLEHELITVVRTMEYPVKDMNIIEQYLFAALNNIYGGRYDLAIQECSIVLELQPQNVLALKRIGSAYFAMKQHDRAREFWERALKLAPDDSELRKHLADVKSPGLKATSGPRELPKKKKR